MKANTLPRLIAVCALLTGLIAIPANANVYATDLRFSAPAVQQTGGATVDLLFRLNEPANQGCTLKIYRETGNQLVRTISIAATVPRGLNTWTWDMRDDVNALVPTNEQYYFTVNASSSGFSDWTLISQDDQALKFYHAKSIDVNNNPNSPNFGRVYIINSRAGTTTANPAPQRTVTRGVFSVYADGTNSLGAPDYRTGGITFSPSLTTTNSPFRVRVGPEGKVYVSDYTDINSGAWVAPGNLEDSTSGGADWPALLSPFNSNANIPSPPAVHGSIPSLFVLGTGLNRTLYTADEDMYPVNNTGGQGSIWSYPIGPLDQAYQSPPSVFWNDTTVNFNQNYSNDIAIDSAGNWYMTQNRGIVDIPTLWKIAPDGNPTPLWDSKSAWGIPDVFMNNSNGLAVDSTRNRLATSRAVVSGGAINVVDLNSGTSPDILSWNLFGGSTTLIWAVGASSAAEYSADAGASFSALTVPGGTVQLNDVHCDSTTTTATMNGFVVGNGGVIFRISARNVFNAETSPTLANLNGVTHIRNIGGTIAGQGWAVGDGGVIVNNLGVAGAWQVDGSSPVTTNLNAIDRRVVAYGATTTYDLYAVGSSGTILRKLTGGAWATQTSPTSDDLNDVSVTQYSGTTVSTRTAAFAVGKSGLILRSTDADVVTGGTWTEVTPRPSTNDLHGVYLLTSKVAWAVGDNGTILRTTDGTTWTTLSSGTTESLRSIWFKDGKNGWAVGTNGLVLATTNGGNSWTTVSGTGSSSLLSVFGLFVGTGTVRGLAFDAVGNLYATDTGLERVRIYSPPDGANNYTTTSYGKFVPTSSAPLIPGTPVVTAPIRSGNATSLSASWSATDAASYRYAIGVTADDEGDYPVKGWTNAGAATSATENGLTLTPGVTYFWYVQAKSANGVWGPVGVSGGTLIGDDVGTAKGKNVGETVAVRVVVTKSTNTPAEFVGQEPDRSAGVRFKGATATVGKLVNVVGTVGVDGPEKVINVTSAGSSSTFTPSLPLRSADPLRIVNKTVGGNAVTSGTGLPDDGLLVEVFGKLTQADIFITPYMYLDDGSGVANDTGSVLGLKVAVPDPPNLSPYPVVGQYWRAQGIVRLQDLGGGNIIRWIDPRSNADLIQADQ